MQQSKKMNYLLLVLPVLLIVFLIYEPAFAGGTQLGFEGPVDKILDWVTGWFEIGRAHV